MSTDIIIYGHDRKDGGFADRGQLRRYIQQIFSRHGGRYLSRYQLHAGRIVLAMDGYAVGYFEIEREEKHPTEADKRRYQGTRKAYVVSKARLFEHDVHIHPEFKKPYNYGAKIPAETYEKIIAKAGELTRVRRGDTAMPNKFCRICWNRNGWLRPNRDARESGDSYVAKNKFGHE
ncbi:MAG: hypothetical protein K8T89_10945, partial [Planctomycetes bacterium]|nr:hypothetical protein [Planctomycetota bacterium]